MRAARGLAPCGRGNGGAKPKPRSPDIWCGCCFWCGCWRACAAACACGVGLVCSARRQSWRRDSSTRLEHGLEEADAQLQAWRASAGGAAAGHRIGVSESRRGARLRGVLGAGGARGRGCVRRQCVAAGDARAQGGCAVTRRATGAQDGSKFVFVARPLRVRLQVRPRQREGVALSRQPHGLVCAWSRGVGLESAGARAAGERRVLGGSAATRRRPVRGERGRAVYRRRWAAGACRALHRCRMPVQDTSADGCPGRAALISQSVTARSGSLVTAPWSRRTCRLPRHVVSAETLRHALGLPPARGHAAGAAAGPDPAEPTVTVQRGCLHGFIAGPRPPFAACCLRPLRSDTAGGLWLQADGVQRRRPARLLAYSGKLSRPRGACRGGGGGGGAGDDEPRGVVRAAARGRGALGPHRRLPVQREPPPRRAPAGPRRAGPEPAVARRRLQRLAGPPRCAPGYL